MGNFEVNKKDTNREVTGEEKMTQSEVEAVLGDYDPEVEGRRLFGDPGEGEEYTTGNSLSGIDFDELGDDIFGDDTFGDGDWDGEDGKDNDIVFNPEDDLDIGGIDLDSLDLDDL